MYMHSAVLCQTQLQGVVGGQLVQGCQVQGQSQGGTPGWILPNISKYNGLLSTIEAGSC